MDTFWEEKKILTAPSMSLISNNELIYINEKISLYRSKKLFDAPIAEKIGVLTGFNTVDTNNNCGGYCNVNTKEIAIVDKEEAIILHECVHAFQYDLGLFDKLSMVFSDQFKLEQHCNSLAKFMYIELHRKDSDIFKSYFNKEDLDWLKNWYDGYFEIDI